MSLNQAIRRIFAYAMYTDGGGKDYIYYEDDYFDDEEYEGYGADAIACFKANRQRNREMKKPLDGAWMHYEVAYLSGLEEYPKRKPEDAIVMNIMEEGLFFRRTEDSMDWFRDYDIAYSAICDISFERRVIKDAGFYLTHKKGTPTRQNRIYITFLDHEGERRRLCLSMMSGLSADLQEIYCSLFMDRLHKNGVLRKIKSNPSVRNTFKNSTDEWNAICNKEGAQKWEFLDTEQVCDEFQKLDEGEEYCCRGRKERYEMPGIEEVVPAEYRALMWQMVEKFQNSRDKMFIHVFEFSSTVDENGLVTERLIHKYPQMDYYKAYEFPTKSLRLDATIQVVEQKDICKMIMKLNE